MLKNSLVALGIDTTFVLLFTVEVFAKCSIFMIKGCKVMLNDGCGVKMQMLVDLLPIISGAISSTVNSAFDCGLASVNIPPNSIITAFKLLQKASTLG